MNPDRAALILFALMATLFTARAELSPSAAVAMEKSSAWYFGMVICFPMQVLKDLVCSSASAESRSENWVLLSDEWVDP